MRILGAVPMSNVARRGPEVVRPWLRGSIPTALGGKRSFSVCSWRNQSKHKPVRDLFNLSGRNYLVTGGGQGIGFAMTRAICEMGGNVAVLDIRSEPVDAFKSLSEEYGVKTEYFQTDVSKEESLKSSFDRAISTLGSLDGLVPAAGIVLDKPFVEWTWEETERVQKVNVGVPSSLCDCAKLTCP